MVKTSSTFRRLKRAALEAGVPARDINMAFDEEELQMLIRRTGTIPPPLQLPVTSGPPERHPEVESSALMRYIQEGGRQPWHLSIARLDRTSRVRVSRASRTLWRLVQAAREAGICRGHGFLALTECCTRIILRDPSIGESFIHAGLSRPRFNHACAVLDGKLHVVGGSKRRGCSDSGLDSTLAVFDPGAGGGSEWTVSYQNWFTPRTKPGCGELEGKMYVTGGVCETG